MRARLTIPTAFAITLAVALLTLGHSAAFAQTGDPDLTGHGGCTLAPNTEAPDVCAFTLDSFLLDRASRLLVAATRWQPVSTTRFAPTASVRPSLIQARALR